MEDTTYKIHKIFQGTNVATIASSKKDNLYWYTKHNYHETLQAFILKLAQSKNMSIVVFSKSNKTLLQ